jgi:DNA-binding PadR family transcriptional regulator
LSRLDVFKPAQGSLYPALYRLEHQGLIAAKWGESDNKRKAKYYSDGGRARRDARGGVTC